MCCTISSMRTLPERLKAAETLLAPYAVPLAGALGREVSEPDDATRAPFQRDRDRIIHTLAFRRLQGKTQVFVTGEESDHVRTRLTHTMEVAQIARDIARTLSLNEDLAECIALSHDLGHPPFGHRGEEALNHWARGHGLTFEHNAQGLRIVTTLEWHSSLVPGLNVNREVLEGIQKHREVWTETPFARGMSLEAQAVDRADEIAYLGHDTDDGLRSRLFTQEEIATVPLVREAVMLAAPRGTSIGGSLIQLLLTDLYAETERLLTLQGIHTLADVYARTEPLVQHSPPMQERIRALRAFLWDRMYAHPRVTQASEEGQRIIAALADHLLAHPTSPVQSLHAKNGTWEQAVVDYIAGMTDSFAKAQYSRLERSR